MKVVILAAGYATRLYPKTLNIPKCLLEYNNKKILDYILDDLHHPNIDEIIIVTNDKFYNQLLDYKNNRLENIKIINDKSTNNSNRLGCIKDLLLAINNIDDDILIMASDNILEFSINHFIDYFYMDSISSIMYYKEYNMDKLKKTGQAVIENNKLIDFKEKPQVNISNKACPPFYIINRSDLCYIKNIDTYYESLGNLIEYLSDKIEIKCYKMIGRRIDIGS
jgi:glucose-1-phosphate thymidylyltransferase